MKRQYLKKTAAAVLISLLCILTACGGADKKVRFGTGGIGGTYYLFGEVFSEILEREDKAWNINVMITAGSEENIKLLSRGKIQLAIVQADVISAAAGTERGSGYGAVAGLYIEACQFVTKADSDIKSVKDLRGKRVSVGEAGSGSEKSAKQILGAYGLNDKMVDVSYLNYTEAADSLRTGKIDAFFCTAGVRTETIEKLARRIGIRILPIEGSEADFVKRIYDQYTRYTIPAGTYTGLDEDIDTVGVRAILLADNNLSEGTVEELTGTLFRFSDELAESLPISFELTEEEAVKGISIDFHKGAEKYYSEKGIRTSSLASSAEEDEKQNLKTET